ncbi:putative high-affinity glucose transporter [Erysiphe pulchra]|uniref:Putative high-affinity glucose transporter n=1 Tax=Erysiphe pulchra TaxID=225359 RepID=A0A2S4PX20_9PEZI|nr:putative high-affinity glucose transporter [Erysiphe pulchra]
MYQVGNIYFIAAVSVVGGALFGFDISSMSAIIFTKAYLCYFNQGPETLEKNGACSGPRPSVQGGIVAAMPGGSWFGALISGIVSDKVGRKKAIQLGAILWCIGCMIVCGAQNISMLIIGRTINGISVGLCSAQVPVYISEIAPPSKRGRLVACQQWAITWGILIMYYIAYGCSFIDGTSAFRIPWGLQMLPAIFLFIGMLFLPESPRWLAKNNYWDEATQVLILVHSPGNSNPEFVTSEIKEIREAVEFEKENANVSYLDLLKPDMIVRTHIGVFCQIWSQLTGMNVMMYYITYIFTMAGLGSNVLLSSSIQFIINVVMTVPALLYVDNWGRRPTLLIGAFLMMAILFTNACLLAIHGRKPYPGEFSNASESISISGAPAKGVIACTYLFVAVYAPTWGPVSWIYPSEIYPLRLRSKAVAVSTSANWAFNFALAYFVPPAFQNIQWRVYLLFGIFCAAMLIHVYLLFPETSKKSLEEVDAIFNDQSIGSFPYIGTPAWKTKKGGKARPIETVNLEVKNEITKDYSGNSV